MKIRKGFVSNSSSSSYICEVCGCHEEGMDLDIADAGMYECKREHIFCQRHELPPDIINEVGDAWAVPTDICPICQLHHIRDQDLLMFMVMRMNSTKPNVEVGFRVAFHNKWDEFWAWRKENYGKYTGHIDGKVSD